MSSPGEPSHSTHSAPDFDPELQAQADRRLSMIVALMLALLAILFAIIVPVSIALLHRAYG